MNYNTNHRKYEIMEAHLKGELTVIDLIDRIVELESGVKTNEAKKETFVNEYVIGNHEDAAEVLIGLMKAAEKFGSVSVADYNDMIGVGSNYKDNIHGWTFKNIITAGIIKHEHGWFIKFPPVEVL
jgi:hypothetical protein